jgi:4-hydroxybenzoate polyprenyltransferase/phosphoserine phosphatase
MPSTPPVLVVDLDGTLIHTDLLVESASRWLIRHPLGAFALLGKLLQGRAALKAWLAEVAAPDATSLPYNPDLLAWLHTQKQAGRRLVLATASHERLANAVVAHLHATQGTALFDEVLATQGDTNLKSEAKRDALLARFGERGFDYVGNDRADLAVWGAAANAHVVSNDRGFIAQVQATASVGQVFQRDGVSAIRAAFKALRLHQWAKNLLVFVPLLAAHVYGQFDAVVQAVFAFFAFGLAASGVYVLNDLADVQDDRHHARKRHRPFAAGHLSLLQGWMMWPALLVAGVASAMLALPAGFVAVLLAYVAITTLYSLWLKQWAVLDVLTLALLYTMRIIGGAVAIGVPLSFWLLLFSMFVFLSLALIKRYSELKVARDNGHVGHLRGRGYAPDDLELVASLGGSAGFISVLVLALYIQDSHTAQLYQSPQIIWVLCPVMLFWISRAWLIAHRGQMHDDPIVFALKDRTSWAVGALVVLVPALARLF